VERKNRKASSTYENSVRRMISFCKSLSSSVK